MARPQKPNGTAQRKPSSNGGPRRAAATEDADVAMGGNGPADEQGDNAMADAAEGEDVEDDDDDEAAEFEMLDRLNEEGAFDSEDGEEDDDGEDDDEEELGEDGEETSDEDDEDDEGGASLPADPRPQGPPLISAADAAAAVAEPSLAAVLHPHRPTPFTYDAGHLLVVDANPLPPDTAFSEAGLTAAARDAAQSLLNHLLTTCAVRNSPAGVTMALPAPTTVLPREKRVPTPRAPTKWEAFARKKGIGKFARGAAAQQQREGRAGKLELDEATGEWVPRYGYKGRNKQGEDDWLVEMDDKTGGKDADGMDVDPRSAKRAERKERVRRQERAQRANERRARQ